MGADRAGPLASRNWRDASRFSGASQGRWAIGLRRVASPARGFPEDLKLESDDLKPHGFSSTKARTIIATAQAVVTGRLDLEAPQRLEDGAAIERLTSLRGIGRWTAEYVLLRCLHIFPGDDVGAHNKLRHLFGIDTQLNYDAVRRLVACWDRHAGVFTCSSPRCPRPAFVDEA